MVDYFQFFVSIFLVYTLVPITVSFIWFKYLPRHEWGSTIIQLILLWLSYIIAIIFINCNRSMFLTYGWLYDKRFYKKRIINTLIKVLNLSIILIVITCTTVISIGAIEGIHKDLYDRTKHRKLGGLDDYFHKISNMGENNIRILIPKLFSNKILEKYLGIFLNIEGENISNRPENMSMINLKDIKGANLYRSDLRSAIANHAFMANANISFCDFRGAQLNMADLRGAKMQQIQLQGAELNGADLSGAHLEGAELYGCKLQYAKFNRAILFSDEFDKSQTIFWKSELQEAQFIEAILINTDFKEAMLNNADFSYADLKEANFYKADLSGAEFKGADLYQTNLCGTDLSKVKGLKWNQLINSNIGNTTVPCYVMEDLFYEVQNMILRNKNIKNKTMALNKLKLLKERFNINIKTNEKENKEIEKNINEIDKILNKYKNNNIWNDVKRFIIKLKSTKCLLK